MKNLSVGDFAEIKRISDVALSPDGTKAAVTVISGSVEKDRYLSDIWLWADGNFRQLTDLGIAASPLWEDNGHIIFPADLAGERKASEKLTVYNRISVEILKSVNFYNYNNRDQELKDVYLIGGGAAIEPLADTIRQTTGLDVHSAADLIKGSYSVDEPWLFLRAICCGAKEK